MIQAITESSFSAYINTEANRIDTSVASTQIRHLMKFTNDLDGAVFYAYGATENIYNRYTKFTFTYVVAPAVPDIYLGQTRLLPSGYYKYEAWEVSWTGVVTVSLNNAPATETDVLPVASTHGVVQGLVAIGKLNMTDKTGTEQVQYTQRQEPSGTNYIWYGQ
jgi:hypothetical protein|tara:strand:+ start:149 stop:637 length:489 start_codon:yes stop_codon:yes gene_type:complete